MSLRRKTKEFLKKWLLRLLFVTIGLLVLWANVHRFRNNTFSNYEKAVDYGRVREEKESIEPVITAIFYEEKNPKKESLSSYLDHSANYRKENVKIVLVPPMLTDSGKAVIETLYKEIFLRNEIGEIFLVKSAGQSVLLHKDFLRKNIKKNTQITVLDFAEFSDSVLDKKGTMAVFPVDLKNGFAGNDYFEKLAEIAGKRHYKTRVFDAIDAEIEEAAEKKYAGLFAKDERENELDRQKNNLSAYKKTYEAALMTYFKINLNSGKKNGPVLPVKNSINYRLYDRGNVYVRLFGEGRQEIFSRAKIGKNKGIAVSLVEVANKAQLKLKQKIKYGKIYLLTDMEPLKARLNQEVTDYLDFDEGIYVNYKNKKALMSADEIAENKENFAEILRRRAQIPASAKDYEIQLYKFKTVEMEYEN